MNKAPLLKQDDGSSAAAEQLPLVVMMDFLDEALIEQKVLEGVARVECWKLQGEVRLHHYHKKQHTCPC